MLVLSPLDSFSNDDEDIGKPFSFDDIEINRENGINQIQIPKKDAISVNDG